MGLTAKIARFYLKNKIRYVLGTPVKLSFNERKLIVINKENKMLFSLLVKKLELLKKNGKIRILTFYKRMKSRKYSWNSKMIYFKED